MKLQKVKGWWLIRLALTIVGKKGLAEMTKASKNAEESQEKVLRSLLNSAKDTSYGKERHFDDILEAKDAKELFSLYQKHVPINDYEGIRPYVERHKSGEADVLFPGKPKMYGTTSGTTKEPKWIPVTERYYQEVTKKMNQTWFYTLIKNKPKVFYGKTLSIVGKAVEGTAPDGTMFGSISGIMQRDIPNFMKTVYSAPADIFWITDYKSRYYALMRMAIEQDVTLILTANPSTLVELQTNVNEFYDEYVNDIEQGVISEKLAIPDEIRAILQAQLKPNPRRAAELRALKAQYGTVLPKHYWPNMQVVNVWMCGNTGVYFEKIKNSFAKSAVFHEFSYVSTECKAGVVLKSNTKDTVAFGHKMYFEFIHESELESENPRVYQLNEVKAGERYCMLVTNSAGLYRYNMNDILKVTGCYNQFPLLQFVQKCNGIISITGEKLHERQFIDAVHAAEKNLSLPLKFFVGFADIENFRYIFYYEFTDRATGKAQAEEFTRLVDANLKEYNEEYAAKRDSNRIKDPATKLLSQDSFERFKAACIEKGYRDGQFKVNLLMQDEMRRAMFQELAIDS
ncbi:MAG: GH3 auxin-responsive promoter family protein [Treponema sp.]|jgi:hypothetical protein|nr:GH3 auxin-responsive promoter family protein [Treponema sp.]